jgi:hypothetical protein
MGSSFDPHELVSRIYEILQPPVIGKGCCKIANSSRNNKARIWIWRTTKISKKNDAKGYI